MTTHVVLLLLIAALGFGDDKDKGRQGNKRYHEKQFQEAATLFREGLASTDESSNPVIRGGLANNLGCALNRTEAYEEASQAFSQAIQLATNEQELTRSTYNAGNNAFQAGNPQGSLQYYRQALLADAANEDARFNYEFVRRLMQQQQDQQGEGGEQQENPQDQQQEPQPSDEEQQDEEQEQDQQGDNSENQQQESDDEQPQPEPKEQEGGMSEEQAEQILQALQNDEEELMRQVWRMKGKPRSVDKDW